MTQSTKFPDAEAIEAAAIRAFGSVSSFTMGFSGSFLDAALNSYRTRTGIDLADVSEKLAMGTHVLVPVEPTFEMMCEGDNVLPRFELDEETGERMLGADGAKECYTAMIRAAQGKV